MWTMYTKPIILDNYERNIIVSIYCLTMTIILENRLFDTIVFVYRSLFLAIWK